MARHPPRFFYGWLIVGVSFLTLVVVFGVRISFSVFFVALIDEYGWLRADTALVYSTSMMVFALTSTLAGMGLDRWGARRTFGLGILFLALGLAFSSRIHTLWQLVMAYGVLASLGITILGLGQQASLIARWFRRRRGAAIGFAFAGTGLGTLVITPGVERMISSAGWREAYLALAGLALLTLPAILFILRLNPAEKNLHPDGDPEPEKETQRSGANEQWTMRAAARTSAFWLVMAASLTAIGPVRMLTVHQLAAITDVGFDRSLAAALIGFAGAVTALTFILSGALSDYIGRRWTYALGSISLILAIAVLGALRHPGQTALLVLYTVLFGVGEGTRSSLVTAVASDLFPGNSMGAINGTVGAGFGLGAAILPWLAGRIYDVSGNYTSAFVIAASAVSVSAFSLWLAPVIKRRTEHGNRSWHKGS